MLAVALVIGVALTRLHSYVFFHSLSELFSIVIALCVFVVAWNARHLCGQPYLLHLGIASFFVAGVDTLHMLAYKGMGVFPEHGADLATQLWIAARSVQASALLAAPLLAHLPQRPALILGAYGLATGLALCAIFWWRVCPACYVEGLGLTPFKKISEYVICALLLASLLVLASRRVLLDRQATPALAVSTLLLIGAEVALTLYVGVYDLANTAGHLLKIGSFYALYRAVVATSLMDPYRVLFRELKASEAALKAVQATLEQRVAERTEALAQANNLLQREITQRRQAQASVETQLSRLSGLRAIDAAIAGSFDLDWVLKVILEQVTGQLGVDAACIHLVQRASGRLEYAAGQGFRWTEVESLRSAPALPEQGSAELAKRPIRLIEPEESLASFPLAALGGEPFRFYYGLPLVARDAVIGWLGLYHRTDLQPDDAWLAYAESLAGQAAIAIDSAALYDDVQRSRVELAEAYDATLEGWALALDMRDRETDGHSQRVAALAVRLAQAMGLEGAELVQIRRGALLHDIGKLAVADAILHKPGPLTPDEQTAMRQHPTHARDMLWRISYLQPALDIPYCHHERWDGSGYPRGLRGEQIPLAARIFGVVDAWDALCSDRPYHRAWPPERALAYLQEQAGRQYDPAVVAAFVHLHRNGKDGDESA
ncbi:MAG: HD domain-containing protein [Anaerolineae bacterium]|nr:HD domain-containing protein [Anaerolineae bacterium]